MACNCQKKSEEFKNLIQKQQAAPSIPHPVAPSTSRPVMTRAERIKIRFLRIQARNVRMAARNAAILAQQAKQAQQAKPQ